MKRKAAAKSLVVLLTSVMMIYLPVCGISSYASAGTEISYEGSDVSQEIPTGYQEETQSALQEVPQNGIPLVIIRIDESEEAIAGANENDPKHEYGTMEQMDESDVVGL